MGVTDSTKSRQEKAHAGQREFFSTDHLNTDLKKRAVRGGGISVIARSADFIIQLAGTMLLARILSPEDFGLVAMVTTVTGFFLIFKDLGLTEATIQSEKINHEQISTLFWINIGFSILVAVAVSCCAPIIAHFYGEPRLKLITVASSLSFVFAGFTTQHVALLRRQMHFTHIAIIEILASLGSLGVTIIFALYGAGYWSLVARPLILAFMMGAGVWVACGWRPGLPVRHAGVRGMIAFGANALGYYCINYFSRNLDKALVGWRSGAGVLGFYTKAYYLFVVPINQFSIPLHGVAVTTLTKLKGDPERFRKFYMRALVAISFVGMPLSTFLAAMGRELILLLLGPKWEPATEIFMVFGLSAGIQIIYATKSWLHVALGRTDRWLRWGLMATVVTALFFFMGIPFGAVGVAVGYTVSLYLLTIPAILYAGKPAGFSIGYILSGIWRYYVAAAGAGILCWTFAQKVVIMQLIVKIAACFGVFTLVYLIILILLYQGIAPISHFYDILQSMVPSLTKKGQKK